MRPIELPRFGPWRPGFSPRPCSPFSGFSPRRRARGSRRGARAPLSSIGFAFFGVFRCSSALPLRLICARPLFGFFAVPRLCPFACFVLGPFRGFFAVPRLCPFLSLFLPFSFRLSHSCVPLGGPLFGSWALWGHGCPRSRLCLLCTPLVRSCGWRAGVSLGAVPAFCAWSAGPVAVGSRIASLAWSPTPGASSPFTPRVGLRRGSVG